MTKKRLLKLLESFSPNDVVVIQVNPVLPCDQIKGVDFRGYIGKPVIVLRTYGVEMLKKKVKTKNGDLFENPAKARRLKQSVMLLRN